MPEQAKYMPRKMVICGGGPKGIAYKPVIRMLHEVNILPNIEDVYGSSVGALLSTALSMGMDPDQIDSFLDTNPELFQDAHKSKRPLANLKSPFRIMRNLTRFKAAFKGDGLFQQSQALIAAGGLAPNATFGELNTLVNAQASNPKTGLKYKNLHVTATVDDPRGSYQIILDAQTCPNMPIALANRISAALPGAFPAIVLTPEDIKYYTQGATKPLIQYTRGAPYQPEQTDVEATNTDGSISLIDGGLVDNLPQYLVQSTGQANDDVISLNLETPKLQDYRKANFPQNNDLSSINGEIDDAIEKVYLDYQELNLYGKAKKYLKNKKNVQLPPSRLVVTADNTVHINTGDVTAFSFNMTPEQREHLVISGYTAIWELLERKGHNLSDYNITPPPENFLAETPAYTTDEINNEITKINDLLNQIGLGVDSCPTRNDVKKKANALKAHQEKNVPLTDEMQQIIQTSQNKYNELIKAQHDIEKMILASKQQTSKRNRIVAKFKKPSQKSASLPIGQLYQLRELRYRVGKAINTQKLEPISRARKKNAPTKINPKTNVREQNLQEHKSFFSEFSTTRKKRDIADKHEYIFKVNRKSKPVNFIHESYIKYLRDFFSPKQWTMNIEHEEIKIKKPSENKEIKITKTTEAIHFSSTANAIEDMLHAAKAYVDTTITNTEQYDYEYELCCETKEQAAHMLSELKTNKFDLTLIKSLTINNHVLSEEKLNHFVSAQQAQIPKNKSL